MLLEQNGERQLQHRYMMLETMTGMAVETVTDGSNFMIKAA